MNNKQFWQKVRILLNVYNVECVGDLPFNVRTKLIKDALQLELLGWKEGGFFVKLEKVFPEISNE